MRVAQVVFIVAVACASAAPPRAEFLALEQRWIAALAAHDVAALNDILDDTFIDSTFRGTIRTKPDVLRGPAAGQGYRSVRLDDVVVRPYGRATVIVTGVNVLEGTKGDQVRVRFTDVFHKRGGAWRAVTAQETLVP